jgi:hypothetical protein
LFYFLKNNKVEIPNDLNKEIISFAREGQYFLKWIYEKHNPTMHQFVNEEIQQIELLL